MSELQGISDRFNMALASEMGFSNLMASAHPLASSSHADTVKTLSPDDQSALSRMNVMAADYGNQSLKLRLAQENLSLTDHSDVGPGKRFETHSDKLKKILDSKAALLLEMRMAMVSNDSWGASNSEEIEKMRKPR